MSPATVYNVTVAMGVAMVGVGAGAAFGWPFGLIATGALMIVLSITALVLR